MRASRRDQFLLISAGPEKAGWLVYGEAPCFGLTFTPNSSTRNCGAPRSKFMIRLLVNGQSYDVDVEPNTPLLWAIRENVGLTGTKYGCGIAQCGACTVDLDGTAVRSCSLPASEAAGKKITTIEGLAQNGKLHPVQQAWLDLDIPQCGYCQSGMIMAVAGLLKDNPKPTDADIDAALTNICRCGTYQRVRAGIHAAAAKA
jgi:isoquinoline 1-oxidoreductase subunit alpha